MTNDLSASDVALMTRDGFGGEGASFMWIFALLLLFWCGNGFGRNAGNSVTEADLCSANSFNELKTSVGRINDQVANVNTNLGNAICQLGYSNLGNFNALERQIGTESCNIQRQVDNLNYNMAQQFAAANANTTAAMQKILDTMCAEKQAAQAARIQQLELNQALCGVVRYPNMMAYNAGPSPFCGCGCSCGCN